MASDDPVHTEFEVSQTVGTVGAMLICPPEATLLLVLGHGAGAGMRHPFMESIAVALASRSIATLRYAFPYMQAGKRRPDRQPVLKATVRAAVAHAGPLASDLPVFAGGKSMGGRMTSLAASEAPLAGVRGLAFLGFPLHAPGKQSNERSDHLEGVTVPMLFVQGTKDRLADIERMRAVVDDLGSRASLHEVAGGDHSFKVPARMQRSAQDIASDIAAAIASWASPV